MEFFQVILGNPQKFLQKILGNCFKRSSGIPPSVITEYLQEFPSNFNRSPRELILEFPRNFSKTSREFLQEVQENPFRTSQGTPPKDPREIFLEILGNSTKNSMEIHPGYHEISSRRFSVIFPQVPQKFLRKLRPGYSWERIRKNYSRRSWTISTKVPRKFFQEPADIPPGVPLKFLQIFFFRSSSGIPVGIHRESLQELLEEEGIPPGDHPAVVWEFFLEFLGKLSEIPL